MAEKDLLYRLTADEKAFNAAFKRATKAVDELERALQKEEQRLAAQHDAMEQVGAAMLGVGAAIAAGLGLAVKAAIEWESAWAGVLKTVEGTPAQMAALEEELRGLTDVLPASHKEIAAVAEAAGQLNVKRQDITEFTRTMIDMGVATNLAAEEAAVALARMSNIMQTAPDDVRRLASTVVDLGNKSASTESEIVAMALRIAGAGHTIGLSEDQVLAFAAALSSVGIEAEAGGSSISRVFIEIDSAVRSGGKELQAFAEVAGMSADEFRSAYARDAAGAINAFILGLGRMNQQGQDVFATLANLNLGEILVRDSLLRLAGAGDLVTESLKNGSEAWDENNALTKEAERRYGTVEARMQIARNQINDFAIGMGNTLLPVVGAVVDFLGGLFDVLGELPGPVKVLLTVVASLAAVIALAGGAAFIAVPAFANMRAAMDQIAAAGGRAAAGVGLLRTAGGAVSGFLAGPWGLALMGAAAVLALFAARSASARANTKDLAQTLDQQTGAVTEATRLWVAHKLAEDGAFDAAERLGISKRDLVDAMLGEEEALARVNKKINDARDATKKQMESGKQLTDEMNKQNTAAHELAGTLARNGDQLDEARALQESLRDSTKGSREEMDALDPAARQLANTFGLSAGEASKLSAEIDELDKALKGLHEQIFGLEEAQDGLTESFRRVLEAAKENGGAITGNSEAAIENRKNLRDLAEAHEEHLVAMRRNGASAAELTAEHERFKQKLIQTLMQMGVSRKEAEAYAKQLDAIPLTVATTVNVDTETALARIARLRRELNALGLTQKGVRVAGVTGGGGVSEYATGGPVRNTSGVVPGYGPTDSVLARVTPGEFVVTPTAARRNRDVLELANATGARLSLAAALPAYASAAPLPSNTGGDGATGPITVNVYPQPGQSETEIAAMVKRELAWQMGRS